MMRTHDESRDGVPAWTSEGSFDSSEDLRTFVTVSRTHPKDIQQRQVIVRLDGGPKMTLLFGQSFKLEVPPGAHCLRAHNTLFRKKVAFVVEPGEHLEFVVINHAGPMTLAMLAVMGAAPLYLSIRRRSLA